MKKIIIPATGIGENNKRIRDSIAPMRMWYLGYIDLIKKASF